MTCSVCGHPKVVARGRCARCYKRAQRNGFDEPIRPDLLPLLQVIATAPTREERAGALKNYLRQQLHPKDTPVNPTQEARNAEIAGGVVG